MARMSSGDRRVELVRAALRVIAERGVSAATTRAIVAEAGMPLASFHYAFESRDAMMRELVGFVVENESVAVFESFRFGSDLRGSIRNALIAYLETLTADPGHEQVMSEIMQYALRTPGLEHLARDQHARYRAVVADLLVTGALNANVVWSLPVEEVARLVVTVTDGITLGWLADRDTTAAHRVIDFAADALSTLASPIKLKEHSA
jgi:DNA-binding transcriptional regulator YbjK